MAAFNILVAVALSCAWSATLGGGWGNPMFATAAGTAAPPLPDCSTALTELLDCLNFVTGVSTIPTPTCCTGVLDLHIHRPACLCELAESNPQTNAIPHFNPKVAATLPASCNITGASISNCPALLGETSSNATSPAGGPSGLPPPPEGGASSEGVFEQALVSSRIAVRICVTFAIVVLSLLQ